MSLFSPIVRLFLFIFFSFQLLFAQNPKYYFVKKDGQWGALSDKGTEIVPCVYDAIMPLDKNFLLVIREKKYGLFNLIGKEIAPASYLSIKIDTVAQLIRVSDTKRKRGVYDFSGKFVLPCVYDSIYPFSEGLAIVKQGDLFGFVDRNGKIIARPKYVGEQSVSAFSNGLAAVEIKEGFGYVDRNNKLVIPAKFRAALPFLKNFAPAQDAKGWGLIDKQGKFINKQRYKNIVLFNNAYYLTIDRKNGKTGVLALNGTVIHPPMFDDIEQLSTALNKIVINNRAGLLDETGHQTLRAEFDNIKNLKGTRYCVAIKGEKMALADASGRVLSECSFTKIDTLCGFENCKGIFRVYIDEVGGLISQTGEVLLPTEYTFGERYDKLMIVYKNGKQGYIDSTGHIIVPAMYDKLLPEPIYYMRKSEALCVAMVDNKFGILNAQGKETALCRFDSLKIGWGKERYISAKLAGKWGVIDAQGNALTPYLFDAIADFKQNKVIVKINNHYGLADTKGRILIPADYEKLHFIGKEKLPVGKKTGIQSKEILENNYLIEAHLPNHGGIGIFDLNGNLLQDFIFTDVQNFGYNGGHALVENKQKLKGLIDSTGKLLVNCEYTYIGDPNSTNIFIGSVAPVQKGNFWGLIDKNGNEILPCEYVRFGKKGKQNATFFIENATIVEKYYHYGFVRKDGSIIAPCIYEDAEMFSGGLAPVKKEGLWGYINTDGKEIIPFRFDVAYPFERLYAKVILNGKRLFIDKNGHELTKDDLNKMGYEEVPPDFSPTYFEGLRPFQGVTSMFGYKDAKNNVILAPQFESAFNYKNGFALVKKNGFWGTIDKLGKFFVPCEYEDIGLGNGDPRKIFYGDLAPIQRNGLYGFVNKAGILTIPAIYSEIRITEKE